MKRLIEPMIVTGNVPLFGHRLMVPYLRSGIDALIAEVLSDNIGNRERDRIEADDDGRGRTIGSDHLRRPQLNRIKQSGAGGQFAVLMA